MPKRKEKNSVSDVVVSDSSPIISFARANKLHIIPSIYKKVIIPQGVYDEIVVKGRGKSGAEEIKNADWISLCEIKNQVEVEKLKEKFGQGESEAVVLAQELKAILLADEWGVIREARRRGIEITSTHLVLIEAKKRRLIESVKKELEELIVSGFRTTPMLIKETLRITGE